MKAIIWKSKNEIKYALQNFYIKADQGSNLVIINPKLVKKLELKIKLINTLTPHCFGMSVARKDSTELKS